MSAEIDACENEASATSTIQASSASPQKRGRRIDTGMRDLIKRRRTDNDGRDLESSANVDSRRPLMKTDHSATKHEEFELKYVELKTSALLQTPAQERNFKRSETSMYWQIV